MNRFAFFRKWISFLKRSQLSTDVLFLLASAALFIHFLPNEILGSDPATGGDTGSHFWPLVTLVKQGLPHFHVRVWNPGNLGGEPHLTHFFPCPYLLMAFFSLFMPLGTAFNIGTALPMLIFPVCVYFCFRALKFRFPIPILASAASLSSFYNESFSMWGGNALSTLAGQFAHLYAVCFFLLGIGSLNWEISSRRFPWLSTLLFAAVLLSHFYIALYIPAVFFIFIFFHPFGQRKHLCLQLGSSGLISFLLAAWFVIPMLHNSSWTTAFGLQWSGSQFYHEAFPVLFWPFSVLMIVGVAFLLFRKRIHLSPHSSFALILMLSLIACSILFFQVFPSLGLVDIRALPTLQLAVCLMAALTVGILLQKTLAKPWVWFLTIFLLAIFTWWPLRGAENLAHWMKWNYSGWQTKPAYPDLKKLSEKLKGDFSQGRVIYENSELSNSAGSMRVFEMLPYFSGRATLESVYMQATVLAPAAFYLQSLISETPSCPFPNYQCSSQHVAQSEKYFQLLGVSDLILVTGRVLSEADRSPFLAKSGDFGLWHLYKMKTPSSLVEVFKQTPKWIPFKDYKLKFYDWLLHYEQDSQFLVAADSPQAEMIRANTLQSPDNCHPQLKVDYDHLELTTDCPGQMHFLKFAYHPTWQASTGDRLWLVSPGFIGLIPSQKTVSLTWGEHPIWKFSVILSWLVFFLFSAAFVRSFLGAPRKRDP